MANRVVYLLVSSAMFFQLIGTRTSKILSPLLALLPFLGYMAIVSCVGWNPVISYLKLLLFSTIFLGFYSVSVLAQESSNDRVMRSIFLCFACFIIIGSVCVIPFPSISTMSAHSFFLRYGYYPTGGLFQGITNQSQTLGKLVAVSSVILLSDLLFSIRKWDKLYVFLLLLTPILIYKTASRTAMGTYLAGICFVSFIFMHARGLGARWKTNVLSILTVLGLLGGIAFMATPSLRQSALNFIFKTRGVDVQVEAQTTENLLSSRQFLIDRAIENFKESPWIGNGFQVSMFHKDLKFHTWKQYFAAPIEKGVWVVAVLEEGGIFGMFLFCLFLVVALTLLLSRHAYIGASGLFVFVVGNLGEFTLFSMSATGGFCWAFIFTGLTMDALRIKQERAWAWQRQVAAPFNGNGRL